MFLCILHCIISSKGSICATAKSEVSTLEKTRTTLVGHATHHGGLDE